MTNLDIANGALGYIGDSFLDSLDTADKRAKVLSDRLPHSRRVVFSSHPWKDLLKRAILDTPDATPPDYQWKNRFPLPADFLRLTGVGEHPGEGDFEYDIENGFILSDQEKMYLLYVADTTTYTGISDYLMQCVSLHLAFSTAMVLTQNPELASSLRSEGYYPQLRLAKNLDSVQKSVRQLRADEFLRSRIGSVNVANRFYSVVPPT